MNVRIEKVLSVSKRMQWASVVPGATLLRMLLIAAILAFVLGAPARTLANAGKFTPDKDGQIAFQSVDRNVACIMETPGNKFGWGRATCNASDRLRQNNPQHSGHISRNGKVSICAVAHPSLYEVCFQNFPPAPALPYGQHIEYAGVRCTSARNGITCIKLTKPREGHGFRVSKDEAVRVKRHLGPRLLMIPTTARNAFFRPSCDLSTRCSARVTIEGGGKVLARGGYSIPAHSSRRVAISLTAAGRAALAGKSRVGAKLTIVDTHTGKRESILVVLTR